MVSLISCMTICNESKLIVDDKKKTIVHSGLPTEDALKVFVEKFGKYCSDEDLKSSVVCLNAASIVEMDLDSSMMHRGWDNKTAATMCLGTSTSTHLFVHAALKPVSKPVKTASSPNTEPACHSSLSVAAS
jgi:hypothetical protein